MSEHILTKAHSYAYFKHKGQFRDDGTTPYFSHPFQVAQILKMINHFDPNLIAAGYLHDVLEDTETTYEELLAEFNQDIADLVNEVTDEGKRDSYGKYFPRLKTQRGVMLKFADRLSNLSDMSSWDEKKVQWYLNKSKFWKDGSDR